MSSTHKVVVHKASIPLAAGESVREFTRKLSDAGATALRSKQNLPDKGTDIFMLEAFSDAVIFEVFKFGPDVPHEKRMRFFAMKFTRKDTGAFDFTDSTEVQRVTRFEPKQTPVTKRDDAQINDRPDVTANSKPSFGNEVSQWEQTSKSFWNDVL